MEVVDILLQLKKHVCMLVFTTSLFCWNPLNKPFLPPIHLLIFCRFFWKWFPTSCLPRKLIHRGIGIKMQRPHNRPSDFWEDFRTLLKMSKDVPTTFQHSQSYLKDANWIFLWKFNWIVLISHVFKTNFSRLVSQAWEMSLVRRCETRA